MAVLVLYEIEGESTDGVNATELPLDPSKEIYLCDILGAFSKTIGLNFNFYVELEDDLLRLESPVSVVPTIADGIVKLVLVRSSRPPTVPHEQFLSFNIDSRRKIYSNEDYIRSIPFATDTFAACGSVHANEVSSVRPVEQELRRQPSTSSQPKKQATRPTVQSQSACSAPAQPPAKPTNADAANPMNLNAIIGEDTVNALNTAAEATKEATVVAAKSLFSFATMSLKSVVDAATNAAEKLSGNLGSMPSTLQVGNTKVSVVRQLAEGGFGTVFLVQDYYNPQSGSSGSGRYYALKRLLCQSKEQVLEAHHELDVLLMCKDNDYFVKLLDYSSTANSQGSGSNIQRQVLLLFPFYARGTCWDAIERCDANQPHWPFSEKKALYVTYCVAQALRFLHEQGFSHRDVKPHNILLSEPAPHEDDSEMHRIGLSLGLGRPVVMDLGSVNKARIEIQNKSQALNCEEEAAKFTSAAYRAPELTSVPYPPVTIDERVDTWGLGCTMYCLAFGHSPFESPKEGVMKLAILNGKFSFPAGFRNRDCSFSTEFTGLIHSMLDVEFTARPFMHEVIDTCEYLLASRE